MTSDETRHLLRRLVFAATPSIENAVRSQTPADAVAALIATSRGAPVPTPPDSVRGIWTNTALRTAGMSDAQYDALRAEQIAAHRRDIDLIRVWWLRELIAGAAPLRENLTLFFEGTFGSSTELVDVPHAIHARNALIRRHCLDSIPALLEALVVDPAMMIQIGMDEHFRARVSDRPAKIILDHWTVGAGAYADADVENLSRALTGWRLTAPPGQEPKDAPDPGAVRAARRTGLTPAFVAEQADVRSKTILGATGTFDARSAIQLLARHPATARRYAKRLLQHFGIESDGDRLLASMADTYQSTNGSMTALLRVIVTSVEFWAPATRWSLIKSPVHLATAACRQLELVMPPIDEINRWLRATGQTLFDTPNGGEGGWPGQESWVTPPDRLAVRYQLPVALSGRAPSLGVRAPAADAGKTPIRLPLGRSLVKSPANAIIARLDPAPGLDLAAIARSAPTNGTSDRDALIRRIMMTPQYQLA